MLRHLNCIFGDERVKSEAAADDAASTVLGNDASSLFARTQSVAEISTVAANGDCPAFPPKVADGGSCVDLEYPIGLSGDLITLLPAGTRSVSLTFRLFASCGKLLTHFEDDLELYLTVACARSLVRDPIAFELPDEVEPKFNKSEDEEQRNYCNNLNFESRRKSNAKYSDRVIRVETPSVLTSSTISSMCSATAKSAAIVSNAISVKNVCCDYECNFRVDGSCAERCEYYFGPVLGLRSYNPLKLPPPTRPVFTSDSHRRLGNGRRQQLLPCRPLSPPLLLEPDGLSGRTEALGCVPSVPVARSRLVTHRGRGRGERER